MLVALWVASLFIQIFHKCNDRNQRTQLQPIGQHICPCSKQLFHSSVQCHHWGARVPTKESTRSAHRRTVPKLLKQISIDFTCKFLLRFQYSASVCVKPGYRQYGLKTCFDTFCHEVISAVPIPISGQALGSISSLPKESMHLNLTSACAYFSRQKFSARPSICLRMKSKSDNKN